MRKPVALALTLAALSSSAWAAPFCVVSGAGAQCFYYDYGQCWQAARQFGGACQANPGEMQAPAPPPPASAPFTYTQIPPQQFNQYQQGWEAAERMRQAQAMRRREADDRNGGGLSEQVDLLVQQGRCLEAVRLAESANADALADSVAVNCKSR